MWITDIKVKLTTRAAFTAAVVGLLLSLQPIQAQAVGACSLSYAHKPYAPRLTNFVDNGWGSYVVGGRFACGKVVSGNPGKGYIRITIEDTLTDGSCAYIYFRTFEDPSYVRRRANSYKRDCNGIPNTYTISWTGGGGIEKVYVGRRVWADFDQGTGYGYNGYVTQTGDISPW